MSKQYVKDKKDEIEKIDEHLSAIADIVKDFPQDASWTKSLNTSLVNFQKKITAFLSTSAELTEEQKKAIKAIRSGKASTEEISALSARMGKTSAGSNDKEQTSTKVKKGSKKSSN